MVTGEGVRERGAEPPAGLPEDPEGPGRAGQRDLPGTPVARIVAVLGAVLALIHIYFNIVPTLSELRMAAIHFAGFGVLCALTVPAWQARSPRGRSAALAVDLLIALAAASLPLYLFLAEDALYARGFAFRWHDWLFTGLAVLLAVELTRRSTGLVIPLLIIVASTYLTVWGPWVPGILTFRGLGWETVLYRIVYTDDGMFGSIAALSYSVVFMFILFGAFLMRSGAAAFVLDFARALVGRLTGGPGFVAVIGSALMGTINGTAVGNVASTGVITIPLMKRAGFPARFAGGVEAAASTGGQIMPPIMGAGAFIMAEYTRIPYLTIAAVAVIPALLYFLSVFVYVRIAARKHGLIASAADTPRLLDVLRRGGITFFVPVGVLLFMLIQGFTPTYCAGFAIAAVVVSSWLTPNRMGPRAVFEALAQGARDMMMVAVLLVGVGVVVNTVLVAGIGNTFSIMMADWSGGNLLVALALVAIASLVLGMGLPVTAAYVVLAVLSAPAIAGMIVQNELIAAFAAGHVPDAAQAILMLVAPDQLAALSGPMALEEARALVALIPPELRGTVIDATLPAATLTLALLSGHMIIFWLSQDSNVTPPVCIPAYAAAALARASPMQTGFTAWRLAKGLYIVPILFAYTPILGGDLWVSLEIALFAAAGLAAFAAAIEGHLENPVAWPLRVLFLGCAVALLWPQDRAMHLLALAVFAALVAWNLLGARRVRPEPAAPQP